jgi:DNA-binding MarR family transcriptional regulator
MSQKADRNQTIEYLISYMPLFHKKILRDVRFDKIPKQHLQLLIHIKKDNGNPMHYYSQKLFISKPNMTVLANKLIKESLLKRQTDKNDRRVIHLLITPKGEEFLESHQRNLKKSIIKRLEILEDEDIQKLNDSFEKIQKVFSKLDE